MFKSNLDKIVKDSNTEVRDMPTNFSPSFRASSYFDSHCNGLWFLAHGQLV